ncbi:chlorhexidine efflux transporter [Neisseriaceae bacterium B1]
MKNKERILHAVLFELGALLVGALVVKWISHDTDNGTAFTVACVLAAMAMCLNFLFNWMFDKILRVNAKRAAHGFACFIPLLLKHFY